MSAYDPKRTSGCKFPFSVFECVKPFLVLPFGFTLTHVVNRCLYDLNIVVWIDKFLDLCEDVTVPLSR